MARMREKASRARPTSYPARPSTTSSSITTTKRDKRHIKHSLLLSRVHKNSSAKRPLHRNRKPKPASTNLSADLSALVDALPGADAGGTASAAANTSQVKAALTGGKSIASKPGVQKRREAVGKAETERFKRNLAAMAAGKDGVQQGVQEKDVDEGGDGSGRRADRLAALRNHIQQSMDAQAKG